MARPELESIAEVTGEDLAFIEWSDDLAIGVEVVDNEHRELINAINDLEADVVDGQDRRHTIQLVARVARESRSHFASEETVMVSARYPGAALHAMKHQHMADQIDAFLGRYSRDTSSLNSHVLGFLRDSLALHIKSEDAIFGRWIREHGEQ